MQNNEPAWLIEARKHEGVAEIPGPKTSGVIAGWLKKLNAWWSDDETPWCGVFVAYCIQAAGLPLPKYWMRAKAWAEWGSRLSAPVPGCIAVLERQGGGHVFFVIGRTPEGNLVGIGGNQGNKVSIATFERHRVIAYVWPPGIAAPSYQGLAMQKSVSLSTDEA